MNTKWHTGIVGIALFVVMILSAADGVTFPPRPVSIAQMQKLGGLTFVFHQPKYIPGDTAFFTGYFSSMPERAIRKQVVSIKLVDNNNQLLLHKRIVFFQGIGSGQFVVPETALPGIYAFVAYTENEDVTGDIKSFRISSFIIAGKNIFPHDNSLHEQPLTEGNSSISLIPDREEIGRRVEVKFKILVQGSQWNTANVSISVFKESLFEEESGNSVHSLSMNTDSSLVKEIEEERLIYSKKPYYFRGRAFIKAKQSAVPDSTRITFNLNRSDFVYSVYSGKDGQFEFPLFKDFGDEEVFYSMSVKDVHLRDAEIELENQGLYVAQPVLGVSEKLDAYTAYAFQKRSILSSYRYYIKKGQAENSAQEAPDFLNSDYEIEMKKFESFPSMADVFMNIVPMVKYRKSNQVEGIRMFLKKTATYAQYDPLFIIDGIMTDNTAYALSLNPDLVERIGVLRTENTLARFGHLGSNGIILLETRIPNHSASLERTKNSLFVTGITKALPYHPVEYVTGEVNSRIPDLRSSLYWNPHLQLDRSKEELFRFFTSDDTGYYVILMHGVGDNGVPFTYRTRFKITADQP